MFSIDPQYILQQLHLDPELILQQLRYDAHAPLIFSSGLFLFLFLGFSFIYWTLSSRRTATLRILFVTAFSYYFYYKSSGFYFALLAIVTVSDYLIARAIHAVMKNEELRMKNTDYIEDETKQHSSFFIRHSSFVRRMLLSVSLLLDLGLLAYFKYTNFFGSLWASVTGGHFTALDIFLPVGISFFTFQSMSYTIDVYRGELRPLKSLLDYAFYVSFFPQLVAGPIVRARDFIPQIRQPLTVTNEMFGRAVFLIMAGLFKKAVISDYISVNFVERVFDQPNLYSGLENLLAVYGYTLQIYCDFSGYSDMAIGLALLLGFRFPKNFDAPYKSRSITEFWRRWHISLSSWLRDYLYISMGGNRHGKFRQRLNLMITMLLGGLWHGASLNFIIWGGYHGLLLCLDKWRMKNEECRMKNTGITDTETKKRSSFFTPHSSFFILHSSFQTLITFHLVCFGWIFFRNQSFDSAFAMLHQIAYNFQPQVFLQWAESYWAVGLMMLIGYTLHFLPARSSDAAQRLLTRMPLPLQAACIVIVAYIVVQIKSSDVQPFIYFQF